MNEPTKETREARHTGKRLAHINAQLCAHLKTAPLPAQPPILHIVAAFGLDASQGDCFREAHYQRAWASLDARDAVPDVFASGYGYHAADAATFTREELLWRHVCPLLIRRLHFRINSDLLPAWKQADMQRIAALAGFDFAAEWAVVCTQLPPPKSWGRDIDPMTLEPTTLMAKWRRAKAALPSPDRPAKRKTRKINGDTQVLYYVTATKVGTTATRPPQEYWFDDDADAESGLRALAARNNYQVVRLEVTGDAITLVLADAKPKRKAA